MPLASVRSEECVLRKRLHGKRAHARLRQGRTGDSDARRNSVLGVISLVDKQRDRDLHVNAECYSSAGDTAFTFRFAS